MRVERLQQQYSLSVQWRSFPLHPDTPAEGLTLEELFRGRGLDIPAMQQRLAALIRAEGLPYGSRTHTYNSQLAQELSKWGDAFPQGRALQQRLFEVYFVEGKNLAEPEVLLAAVESVGLPREEAHLVLADRSYQTAVEQDWNRAGQLGITGVPTFVMGNRGVVGAQPYDVLEQLVRSVEP